MNQFPSTGVEDGFVSRLRSTGVVAVIRAPSAALAMKAVDALVAGGVTGIEITYSTPRAPDVIAQVGETYGDHVLLGAGTVVSARQADDAFNAGATFLVSPGTTVSVARSLKRTGAAVMLGVMTPSELMTAVELGTDVIKLFPASIGGIELLRSLRGPFPAVPIMPTGGVTPDNLSEWIDAGAIAVGAGSDLCSPLLIRTEQWQALTDRARTFIDAFHHRPMASAR